MSLFHPRLMIAALRGGSGKTILSLGLISAWKERGHKVSVFKKGPDFIDAGWLAFVAGKPCYNLDPFLMTREQILGSFSSRSAGADVSLVEGNRGLFDGLDLDGCCSTAELARLLGAPTVLIVDVTMTTRTVAALVLGCQKFDPDLRMAGVILNRVGGARQESVARNAVERYCGIPVLGAVPKLKGAVFPERHMGLVPHLESGAAEKAVQWARNVVEQSLDLDSLWKIAHSVEPPEPGLVPERVAPHPTGQRVRIGVFRDRSFWFYYPENLLHLQSSGATLVEIDSLSENTLPELDGLYIGGGFPETQAEALAANAGFRSSLKKAIEEGLPVYAECGGLMYLGERLLVAGKEYPMVGALPISFALEERPQGHGYTVLEVDGKNPYYPPGVTLRGHEFHYSRPLPESPSTLRTVFKVLRGRGIDGRRDGIVRGNLLAAYSHLHAGGTELWGNGLVRAAQEIRAGRKGFSGTPQKND
jgi:cobyrinic acid a,c-diamide synthase